jgi:PBP1b-binding outer membrane lipoprotein LpoB
MLTTTKKNIYAIAVMAFCSMLLLGCSEDPEKKTEKKTETKMEQIGKQAAQDLKKPLEDARKAAAEAGAVTSKALNEAARETKSAIQEATGTGQQQKNGKEKKKLEGC